MPVNYLGFRSKINLVPTNTYSSQSSDHEKQPKGPLPGPELAQAGHERVGMISAAVNSLVETIENNYPLDPVYVDSGVTKAEAFANQAKSEQAAHSTDNHQPPASYDESEARRLIEEAFRGE